MGVVGVVVGFDSVSVLVGFGFGLGFGFGFGVEVVVVVGVEVGARAGGDAGVCVAAGGRVIGGIVLRRVLFLLPVWAVFFGGVFCRGGFCRAVLCRGAVPISFGGILWVWVSLSLAGTWGFLVAVKVGESGRPKPFPDIRAFSLDSKKRASKKENSPSSVPLGIRIG